MFPNYDHPPRENSQRKKRKVPILTKWGLPPIDKRPIYFRFFLLKASLRRIGTKNEKKSIFVTFLGSVSKKMSPFFRCFGLFTLRCVIYIWCFPKLGKIFRPPMWKKVFLRMLVQRQYAVLYRSKKCLFHIKEHTI